MDGSLKSILSSLLVIVLFGFSFMINSDLEYKEMCSGNEECIFNLVIEENSSSLCEISEYPESCYKRAVFELGDSSLCDFTENSSYCYMSLAVETRDTILCDKLEEKKDYCIFQVATYANSPDICNSSIDSAFCYYSYALYANDSKICDLSEKYKSTCHHKLLGSSTNESNWYWKG